MHYGCNAGRLVSSNCACRQGLRIPEFDVMAEFLRVSGSTEVVQDISNDWQSPNVNLFRIVSIYLCGYRVALDLS